jgi:hypothetical protein
MHGGILDERECSSMVEENPTSTKHDHRRCVMGTVRGMISRELFVMEIHGAA